MDTVNYNEFGDKWKHLENSQIYHQEVDEKTLFTDVGEVPVTQRQLNLYNYFLFIKKHLEGVHAKDVLEVGCGRGTISLYLVKYLGLRVTLLDNVQEALNIAKNLFAYHGQEAEYFLGNALALDFSESTYDAVVSIGLAEHIDNVEALFAEQYRVLRDGGVVVSLNIPKKFSIQLLNVIMRLFKRIFGKYSGSLNKDYYRNLLSPADYVRIAEQVGFTDIKVVYTGPFPVLTPISLKNDKRVTMLYKHILKIKSIFQPYAFKTNKYIAQGHFIVGYKKL